MSTFLARQFTFIIDPLCVPSLLDQTYRPILDLIVDLKACPCPVEIFLLVPTYLADSDLRPLVKSPFYDVGRPKNSKPFDLDPSILKAIRDGLLRNDKQAKLALDLMSLSFFVKADGIVTSSQTLFQARYHIDQQHLVRVIPLEDFADTIEVCAHGHSIFWSVTQPNRELVVDIFYQRTHWKHRRLFQWFETMRSKTKNEILINQLRTALLNRYSFILYARDMIRFYDLQKDHYARREMDHRFSMPLGYHLNAFYLFLWGMLEQLSLIAKHAMNLKVDERDCGIRSKKFWFEFEPLAPSLSKFLTIGPIADWISTMGDVRHLAAHKMIPMPTNLLEETDESRKSAHEILEILRKERADDYRIFSSELMKLMEPYLVFEWRLSKMKKIAQNVVVIETKDGGYIRNPIASVDYDLFRLNAVIDAVLVTLFSTQRKLANCRETKTAD